MKNDEIARALRKTCENSNPTPCCEFEVLGPAAADLIESLQAQLAASQRREKAAAEDILIAHEEGRCAVCLHMQDREQCAKWPDRACFEWRGPQQDGGGN